MIPSSSSRSHLAFAFPPPVPGSRRRDLHAIEADGGCTVLREPHPARSRAAAEIRVALDLAEPRIRDADDSAAVARAPSRRQLLQSGTCAALLALAGCGPSRANTAGHTTGSMRAGPIAALLPYGDGNYGDGAYAP